MCRCIILCDMYMKHWYFVHLTFSADKWIVAYYDSQWNFTKWFTALSGLSKTVDIIVNICMCWWSCLDKNKFYSTLFFWYFFVLHTKNIHTSCIKYFPTHPLPAVGSHQYQPCCCPVLCYGYLHNPEAPTSNFNSSTGLLIYSLK